MLMIEKTTVVNLAQLLPTSPGLSVTKAPAVVRSPSEEARALEARQTQRRAKIGVRYKTKNCHTFAESGECKYGEACVFAHGEEELAKYIAIAEAAEAITDVVSVAGPPPQTETAPPATGSKNTKTASQVEPAVGSKGSVTPQTAPSKYRDALMKSVPSVAPSTPTASKKEAPAQPATKQPQQATSTTATPPTFLMFTPTPVLVNANPKRCDDYGFGGSVSDERQRATEGNRRVPQVELERYRLERKAEAIARAKISETGSLSLSTPASPTSPAPSGEGVDDFTRYPFGQSPPTAAGSNSFHLSERCDLAAFAVFNDDVNGATPVQPMTHSNNASSCGTTSTTSNNPMGSSPPDHYNDVSGWGFVNQAAASSTSGQQQGSASPATSASRSARFSHNPYATN